MPPQIVGPGARQAAAALVAQRAPEPLDQTQVVLGRGERELGRPERQEAGQVPLALIVRGLQAGGST